MKPPQGEESRKKKERDEEERGRRLGIVGGLVTPKELA
jgi:hypothetical protein